MLFFGNLTSWPFVSTRISDTFRIRRLNFLLASSNSLQHGRRQNGQTQSFTGGFFFCRNGNANTSPFLLNMATVTWPQVILSISLSIEVEVPHFMFLLLLLICICKSDYPYTLTCLLYTSPSPRDGLLSRMPSSA